MIKKIRRKIFIVNNLLKMASSNQSPYLYPAYRKFISLTGKRMGD